MKRFKKSIWTAFFFVSYYISYSKGYQLGIIHPTANARYFYYGTYQGFSDKFLYAFYFPIYRFDLLLEKNGYAKWSNGYLHWSIREVTPDPEKSAEKVLAPYPEIQGLGLVWPIETIEKNSSPENELFRSVYRLKIESVPVEKMIYVSEEAMTASGLVEVNDNVTTGWRIDRGYQDQGRVCRCSAEYIKLWRTKTDKLKYEFDYKVITDNCGDNGVCDLEETLSTGEVWLTIIVMNEKAKGLVSDWVPARRSWFKRHF